MDFMSNFTSIGLLNLFKFSEQGNLEGVRQVLFQSSELVNEANEKGQTALFRAAKKGHAAIAKFLLDHGANVDFVNVKGTSPLIVAAKHGNTECVRLFVEKGAKLELQDKQKRTALFRATERRRVSVIEFLISKGANRNIVDANGRKPIDIILELEKKCQQIRGWFEKA